MSLLATILQVHNMLVSGFTTILNCLVVYMDSNKVMLEKGAFFFSLFWKGYIS